MKGALDEIPSAVVAHVSPLLARLTVKFTVLVNDCEAVLPLLGAPDVHVDVSQLKTTARSVSPVKKTPITAARIRRNRRRQQDGRNKKITDNNFEKLSLTTVFISFLGTDCQADTVYHGCLDAFFLEIDTVVPVLEEYTSKFQTAALLKMCCTPPKSARRHRNPSAHSRSLWS